MREWAARLALALTAPLVFLLVLEGGLRLAGARRDLRFFVATADGQAWSSNPDFGRRFFSPGYQIHPEPVRIPRRRAPGERRVVLLGGSAAFGDLDFGYGLARFLELMLSGPAARVRVVNAALPGASSHLLRIAARDAQLLEPDALVVYAGHNEVVGPFGPASIVTGGSPGLAQIRAWVALSSTALGQALEQLLRGALGTPALDRSPGPAAPRLLAEDDPRVLRAREHLAANLGALIDAARRAGTPVLLATPASNLRDQPPLGPLPVAGLPPERREAWRRERAAGRFELSQRQAGAAVLRLSRAAELAPLDASLQFDLARALEADAQPQAARRAYARARDLDGLRARADGPTLARLRALGARPGVSVVDVAARLQALGGRAAPGRGLFYDHVHLTLRGSHAVAALLLEPVARALGLGAPRAPDFDELERRLPVTAWDRFRLAERLARRGRFDGSRRRAPLPPSPAQLDAAARRYAEVLAAEPEALAVRERAAELALARGRPGSALALADGLVEALPGVARWQRLRGAALAAAGRDDEALAACDAALAIDPDYVDGRLERAALRQRGGDRSGAIEDLEAVLRIQPAHREAGARLDALRPAP